MRLAIPASRLSLIVTCLLASSALAAQNPLVINSTGFHPRQPMSVTQLIEVVDPATINCMQNTTFDDIPGGPAPGTNYDGIMVSVGVAFDERFLGQTLSYNGNFDVLSGSPSNPLTLAPGNPGQNLNVFDFGPPSFQLLTGLGPLGYPDFDAIGEGAFAIYFTADQSELKFDLLGGDGGSAQLDFFRRDGSLIDTIVLTGLANISYGFRRVGGVQEIAGVSVQNSDGGGIGVDNVCHDVIVVPTRAGTWGEVKNTYR